MSKTYLPYDPYRQLLRRAQEVDDDEDRRYGEGKRGDELPQELSFREGRLENIRKAMAELEVEAQAAAEQADAEGKENTRRTIVPEDKAQRNFTDAESRIMPAPGDRNFVQAYNCQAVVDQEYQVIVAAQATNRSSDKQQELPEKPRHGRSVPPAPRGRIPSHLSARDRMWRKLQTKRGRQGYALRMQTVEPVFGQIKQGRGFRQFLLRGLEKVDGEWSLICTGHNLFKLFRFGRRVDAMVGNPSPRPTNYCKDAMQSAGRLDRPNSPECIRPRQLSSDRLLVRHICGPAFTLR